MKFLKPGENRLKRIADMLEKVAIAMISLVSAKAIFEGAIESSAKSILVVMIVGVLCGLGSYALTKERTIEKPTKKGK